MDTAGTEGRRVREQVVSLAELFYDLVYVYAIARMTSLFHGVQVAPDVMGAYILTPFAGLAGGAPHSSPDRFWRAWPASPGCCLRHWRAYSRQYPSLCIFMQLERLLIQPPDKRYIEV